MAKKKSADNKPGTKASNRSGNKRGTTKAPLAVCVAEVYQDISRLKTALKILEMAKALMEDNDATCLLLQSASTYRSNFLAWLTRYPSAVIEAASSWTKELEKEAIRLATSNAANQITAVSDEDAD